jgi:hypothetical protein
MEVQKNAVMRLTMQALRGRGGIAPTHSTSALDAVEWLWSRSGRALPQGKDLRYPLDRRLDGSQSRSGHRG